MQENPLHKLTDEQNIKKIASSLMKSPKSANQLSMELDINLNSVIRILKTLEDEGLIK